MVKAPRSPVGVGSVFARRKLAEQLAAQAEKVVLARNGTVLFHSRRSKLYFVVPAPGDKVAQLIMMGIGSEFLGNKGRISARMRHTARAGKTRSDIRHALRRLAVGALNDDGQMPLVEHLMTIIRTSRSLKSLEGLPAGIGSLINTGTSIGIPILKLLTADSARAKVSSFIGNAIIGSIVSAFDAPLGTVAFYLNGQRLEDGLDMGDQIADIGGFLAYKFLLDHPDVGEKRKVRLAQAFLAEYTAVPRRSRRTYTVARTVRGPLHQAARAADTVASASSRLESLADIPGVGEAGAVARVVKSVAATSERPPRSMSQRVAVILQTAPVRIAEQQALIAQEPGHPHHDAQSSIAIWSFRREVALALDSLAKRAEQVIAPASSQEAAGHQAAARQPTPPVC